MVPLSNCIYTFTQPTMYFSQFENTRKDVSESLHSLISVITQPCFFSAQSKDTRISPVLEPTRLKKRRIVETSLSHKTSKRLISKKKTRAVGVRSKSKRGLGSLNPKSETEKPLDLSMKRKDLFASFASDPRVLDFLYFILHVNTQKK